MRRASFASMDCSIAQCLEVIGEWWTPLIIRDLLFGVQRFEQLQSRLGISRNILTERLNHLVDQGVVERVQYNEAPPRYEYQLTAKGHDLWKIIALMRQWGDDWAAPEGPPISFTHRECGEALTIDTCCAACGERLTPRDMRVDHDRAGISHFPT